MILCFVLIEEYKLKIAKYETMGNKNSSNAPAQHSSHATLAPRAPVAETQHTTPAPSHRHDRTDLTSTSSYQVFTPPKLIGLPDGCSHGGADSAEGALIRRNPAAMLLLTEPLVSHLAKEMPPPYRQAWKLLFSSTLHGHSFSRLAANIENKGAVLLIIKEGGERGHYFGGFNAESWVSAEAREEAAVSRSAAMARAQRTGCASGSSDRPENQAPNFFGNKDCFVFTSGDLTHDATTGKHRVSATNIQVCHSNTRSSANANYMYWFSNHPIADMNGMGMGSDKATGAGEFAWFMDRYLSKGRSSLRTCPTFNSLLLTVDDEFTISAVEAYAVDPVAFLNDDSNQDEEKSTIHGNSRYAAERMLLELNGHSFYDPNQREDC